MTSHYLKYRWFHLLEEICANRLHWVNTSRPRQDGHHFPDDIFKCVLNENLQIFIKMSLTFVPKGPINNIPALVQIMAWRRSGDKPLSEPRMVSLLTQICVARLHWVNHDSQRPVKSPTGSWKVPKSKLRQQYTGSWKPVYIQHFLYMLYIEHT